MTARRRSRGGCLRGCFGGLLTLVALGVALYAGGWAFDVFVQAPWAYAIGGRPTLTGTWVGSFQSPAAAGGASGRLALEIERGGMRVRHLWTGTYKVLDPFDHSRYGAGVHGSAAWCRPDGSVVSYNVAGTIDRRARQVVLTLATVSTVKVGGPQFDELHGSWSGDRLSLLSNMRMYYVAPGRATAYGPTRAGFDMQLRKVSVDRPAAACGVR